MVTVVATVGAVDANSYLTVAEADAYFDGRLKSDGWISNTSKDISLVYATSMLDYYMDWDGYRHNTEEYQALEWPRDDVIDTANDIVPTRIKNAVCELALYVSDNGDIFNLAEVSKMKVGPISFDLDVDGTGYLLPPQISRMLSSLGTPKGVPKNGVSSVRVYR